MVEVQLRSVDWTFGSDLYPIPTAFILATGFALFAGVLAYAFVPKTHVSTNRTMVRPWELDVTVPALAVGGISITAR